MSRIRAHKQAAKWNADHDIGAPVRYWPGRRQGEGRIAKTRSMAQVIGDHTAVVWVEGHSSCVALSHVEALS